MLKKKKLTIDVMLTLENWLVEKKLITLINQQEINELLNSLKLKIEYVGKNDLPNNTEAILMPYQGDDDFLGLIKLRDDLADNPFACVHEIIHYFYDVGQGKKVTMEYTRKITGKTENEHEQRINYMTAACIMPKTDISEYIKKYDEQFPKVDTVKFISELCKFYHQNEKAVIRRIQEVRKLNKSERKTLVS